MDKLNYFNPYQSKNPKHEDNLTRGFLVLVATIPAVQTAFFELIREKQIQKIFEGEASAEDLLPGFIQPSDRTVNVQTQTGSIGEKGKLLSILISDERLNYNEEITASDRSAIYDGVINMEIDHDEWIFIIENKPNVNNVWKEQLHPSLIDKREDEGTESIEIVKYFVSIQWLEIIDMLYSLIDSNLVSGGEKNFIQHFFDYVNEYYPGLNPYDTFAKCGDSEVLIKKRCNLAMENLSKDELGHHRGWKTYIKLDESSVKRVTIYPTDFKEKEWNIVIALFPGDTVSQARSFYKKLATDDNAEKLLNLVKDSRWSAQSNLHFSHISKHLLWTSGKLSFEDYIKYWVNHRGKIKQFKKKGSYNYLYEEFLDHGLIVKNDIRELEQLYENRNTMNVCPGVRFSYTMKKSEVLSLESEGSDRVEKEIMKHLNSLLSCWTDNWIELVS